MQRLHCPAPSQVPAPVAQGVVEDFGTNPHLFEEHWAVTHSFAEAGQSVPVVHATHAPARQMGVLPVQAFPACHWPFASQTDGTRESHFFCP